MPALTLATILLSTSFGAWGAAHAVPLATPVLRHSWSCALPVEPVRRRSYGYYRYRYDRDNDDDEQRLLGKRNDETYGGGPRATPFTAIAPPRRGRWVDPPPAE